VTKAGSGTNDACVRSLEKRSRGTNQRERRSHNGLTGVATMSIREELREMAWLASVITALSMLSIGLAVALAAA
jgi:hypothetical protein